MAKHEAYKVDHYVPFTTITLSPLIQSAVGLLFDSRNAATNNEPNVVLITTIVK